jgi:hypothetical protein
VSVIATSAQRTSDLPSPVQRKTRIKDRMMKQLLFLWALLASSTCLAASPGVDTELLLSGSDQWSGKCSDSIAAAKKAIDAKVYNVKRYGAIGDGKAMETKAVQKTIDACHNAGGGIVRFQLAIFKLARSFSRATSRSLSTTGPACLAAPMWLTTQLKTFADRARVPPIV